MGNVGLDGFAGRIFGLDATYGRASQGVPPREGARLRRGREFEPGDRVRVVAAGRATQGRAGTVVAPDESWPFGPCVLLDGDSEPGAYDEREIDALAPEDLLAPGPASAQPRDPSGASPERQQLARAVAALILEERRRLTAEWQAKLETARAETAAARATTRAGAPELDRAALAAVLTCAEEYISGAPLNRALVLHALRAALVQLGERPGLPSLVDLATGRLRG